MRRNRFAAPRLLRLRFLPGSNRDKDRRKLTCLPFLYAKNRRRRHGGDHAPGVVVEGALWAAREFGVDLALVGQKELVEHELVRHPTPSSSVQVVHASQIIAMNESPSSALKKGIRP